MEPLISRIRSRRSAIFHTLTMPKFFYSTLFSRSPLTPADMQSLAQPKADQALSNLPSIQTPGDVDAPTPVSTIYATPSLDPATIKSPKLPNGETTAVVTEVVQ